MSEVHVQVRVGSELYALPVAHVLEVGEIGILTVAPGASRATLGVCNLRGDLLPVFDLATVRAYTPASGDLSEQVDATSSTLLGNLPYAPTHLALIHAALALRKGPD